MKTEKFKVTPLERAWILYDVGNSAFVLMIATLVPIFFNALAEAGGVSKVDYLAYWGYASSIVTVITAIIDMATAYGTALGLETTGLLLALLVTQIVAFPSALIFGRLSAKYPSSQLIPVCIAAYTGIAVFAFFLTSQWQFWVLAVLVGMFQGGVQALSRSHFAKIIPQEKSGEYFGLFDICGKGASFLGTMIVSVGSQLTGSANVGVGSIAILFVIGFVLFRVSCRTEHAKQV